MSDRPPRIQGFSYRGLHRYFLTFCTPGRQPHFRSASNVQPVLTQFLRVAADEGMEIAAYCFMPDHVHLLVAGKTDSADLRRFARLAKQRTAFTFAREPGGVLWQEGYFDRVVRSDEEEAEKLGYMLANPIRAGLTQRIEDYPFVGSERWSITELAAFVQDGVRQARRRT